MKKSKKLPIVLVLFVSLVLILALLFRYSYLMGFRPLAIAQIPARIELPVEYGIPVKELSVSDFQFAREYSMLSFSETSLGIARIAQDPASKYILAVDRAGKFRKWDAASGKLVAEYDIFATDEHSTFFSEDGSLFVSKGGAVWDTSSGQVLYCSNHEFIDCAIGLIYEPDIGFYLDPLGRQFIGVFARSLDWNSYFAKDNGFQATSGSRGGRLPCWDFVFDWNVSNPLREAPFREGAAGADRIVIDPSGNYVACSLSNGAIIVRNWNTSFDLFVNSEGRNQTKEEPYVYFLRYKMPKGDSAEDMAFDPTRTWLSVLTSNEMVVWDLRRWIFASHLDVPVSDGNVIAFDRSGKLLALGTKRGITFFDVEQAEQIANFDVGKVTALYFTRDNRLLVWGDAQGNVHIWGVPEK